MSELALTDKLRKQMLEELKEYGEIPRMENDEFIVSQFAELWKITRNQAQTRVRKAVDDGKITARKVIGVNGRQCTAYRIVGKGERD